MSIFTLVIQTCEKQLPVCVLISSAHDWLIKKTILDYFSKSALTHTYQKAFRKPRNVLDMSCNIPNDHMMASSSSDVHLSVKDPSVES